MTPRAEVVRERNARERNKDQKFRLGSPPADLKFESGASIPITGLISAAQGLEDVTIIIYARSTDLGADFSTGFLRMNVRQSLNNWRIDVGNIASGSVAMPTSPEPRTMVVAISPTAQGKVKAWINGVLILDSAYDGSQWSNGFNAIFLRDPLDALPNPAIPEMEIILGALPAIF